LEVDTVDESQALQIIKRKSKESEKLKYKKTCRGSWLGLDLYIQAGKKIKALDNIVKPV
jgi:hypothetical protein